MKTQQWVPVRDVMRTEVTEVDGKIDVLSALKIMKKVRVTKMAVTIEQHYGRPMDIEWGKDGITGELFILQARPETVQSRSSSGTLERFQLQENVSFQAEIFTESQFSVIF